MPLNNKYSHCEPRFFRRSNLTGKGFTIIEIMLVLAVMSAIIVTGLRYYQTAQQQNEFEQAKNNVNILFASLDNYYQMNCQRVIAADGVTVIKPGNLDPNNPSVHNPFPIDIDNDLVKSKYFTGKAWPFPPISFIADTDAKGVFNGLGYAVQFNQANPSARLNGIGVNPQSVGMIYIWKEQVAIQLRNSKAMNINYAQALKSTLQADCLTSDPSTIPCDNTPGGPPYYLVWERLPSYAAPQFKSSLWQSSQQLKQFNQMYTVYPINMILNKEKGVQQNYLCGG